MSTYIKLSTLEYPRHVGDIAIDPQGSQDYELVQWVDRPEYNHNTQICYELAPKKINSIWLMQWAVRELTEEEIQDINQSAQPNIY